MRGYIIGYPLDMVFFYLSSVSQEAMLYYY